MRVLGGSWIVIRGVKDFYWTLDFFSHGQLPLRLSIYLSTLHPHSHRLTHPSYHPTFDYITLHCILPPCSLTFLNSLSRRSCCPSLHSSIPFSIYLSSSDCVAFRLHFVHILMPRSGLSVLSIFLPSVRIYLSSHENASNFLGPGHMGENGGRIICSERRKVKQKANKSGQEEEGKEGEQKSNSWLGRED